jgi:hypothetical protein
VPNENDMAGKQTESNEAAGYNNLLFPPERIVRLLVGIKSAIGLAEARAVSFEGLEQLSGRPAGTIGSWFEGARMNQLEFLFNLLERVPSRLRHDLLDAACRTQPKMLSERPSTRLGRNSGSAQGLCRVGTGEGI